MKGIEDLVYTKQLGDIINELHKDLGINSIAFTGGEPLLHDGLCEIISHINLNTNVCKFSLTTNGTIPKNSEYWSQLFSLGLYKVNISMPGIPEDEESLLSDKYIKDIFEIQSQTIGFLNKIGIERPKINIVVFNDVLFTKSNLSKLLNFRDELNSELVLLPDLRNQEKFDYSQTIINELRKDMRLRKIDEKRNHGTSNTTEKYCYADDGKESNIIFIKSTKMQDGNPYRLESICEKCPKKIKKTICQEGFYGIRLEQINSCYYIRLCIHKNTSDVLMKYKDFTESKVYKEIKSLWELN